MPHTPSRLSHDVPTPPERVKPTVPDGTVTDLIDLVNSTTLSRFAAEEELDHGGIDALYRLFTARVVDNITAWAASGDWPDRRRTAAEVVAELVEAGELDLDDPAAVRLLNQARSNAG